jgi:YD repeat-containing protein
MHGRRRQGRRADGGPPKGPPTSLASVGNILTKHHEGSNPLTMSYDAANRLTTSLLGTTQLTTYTYSNAGEMTEERCDSLGIRATFVYDGEHRCVNEVRATTSTYTYAFDGLRRSAHMAGTANAISFVWDGTDLLNEYVPGGLSGRYLTLDGEVIAEKRGASRYVYGADPLGSVVHLLDSGLNRAATYVYWPYGEVLSHTGVDTPMQFVGNLGYYTATTNRVSWRGIWLRTDLGARQITRPVGGYPLHTKGARSDREFHDCVWGRPGPPATVAEAVAFSGAPDLPSVGAPRSQLDCNSRCGTCFRKTLREIENAYETCMSAGIDIESCKQVRHSQRKVAWSDKHGCLRNCEDCFRVRKPPRPQPVYPQCRVCSSAGAGHAGA